MNGTSNCEGSDQGTAFFKSFKDYEDLDAI